MIFRWGVCVFSQNSPSSSTTAPYCCLLTHSLDGTLWVCASGCFVTIWKVGGFDSGTQISRPNLIFNGILMILLLLLQTFPRLSAVFTVSDQALVVAPFALQGVNDGRGWGKSLRGPRRQGLWGSVLPAEDFHPAQRPVRGRDRWRGAQRGGGGAGVPGARRDLYDRGGSVCVRRGEPALPHPGPRGLLLPETNHPASELVSQDGLQPISFSFDFLRVGVCSCAHARASTCGR